MKKITILVCTLIGIFFGTQTFGQFQANVRAVDNKLIFSIRPSSDVNNVGFSTIEFFLRYPAASPTFTYGDLVENSSNFPGIGNFKIVVEPQSGGFKIDHFVYTAPEPITTLKSFTANQVYDLLSVDLIGSPAIISTMEFVHKDSEDPFYLAITGQSGQDLRSGNSSTLFYPTTTTEGTGTATIYKMSLSNVPLPVKFLSFIALKTSDDAKLSWTVENDGANKYFDIERSTDGKNFSQFARVPAAENGKSVNTYELTDSRISGHGSTVYYRIKQVDQNGGLLYSSIRNLNTSRRGAPVQLYPNPAKTITKLVFDAEAPGRGSILVRDMQGRLALQWGVNFIKGINQQDINVSSLASGDYNVTVAGEGFSHVLKLTKVN